MGRDREKNQQVFIDALTLVMRMIDFSLHINIHRSTYAEKCMNMVHVKRTLLRALPLYFSPTFLPFSRGHVAQRFICISLVLLLFFSFYFLILYHSFVCWFFISASFVDAVICLLARA